MTPSPTCADETEYREAKRELTGWTAGVEKRALAWLAAHLPAYVTPDQLTVLGNDLLQPALERPDQRLRLAAEHLLAGRADQQDVRELADGRPDVDIRFAVLARLARLGRLV